MRGFIYVWRDRRDRRFYIGSHVGKEDDGYIASSSEMLSEYKKRPSDFKRRIVAVVSGSIAELSAAEQRWLDMIDVKQLGLKFYNLSICVIVRKPLSEEVMKDARRRAAEKKRGRKMAPRSAETRRRMSIARKGKGIGRVFSEETKEKLRLANIGKKHSAATKEKISAIVTMRFADPEERRMQADRARGRKQSPEAIAKRSQSLTGRTGWAAGTIWINDGMVNIQHRREISIPDGFSRGRVAKTLEMG